MEQRCYLWAVWLTWLGLPLLAVVVGLRNGWLAGGFVLLVGVAGQMLYIRWFPSISRWVGYGSVADVPATSARALARPSLRVVLYTANVCPFCLIVKRRLTDLQQSVGFELEELARRGSAPSCGCSARFGPTVPDRACHSTSRRCRLLEHTRSRCVERRSNHSGPQADVWPSRSAMGAREVYFQDPDGNVLRFGEPTAATS